MAPRTPNYSFERSQRERAQQAKAQKRADLRAEKAAKRKGGEDEAAPATEQSDQEK
jgi:hypothetical protein